MISSGGCRQGGMQRERPEPAVCHGLGKESPLRVSHAKVLVCGEVTGWRGQRVHQMARAEGSLRGETLGVSMDESMDEFELNEL